MHASEAEIPAGVRRLGSRWVNWFLIDDPEGPIAIDSGLPRHPEQASRALRDLGRERLSHVILTHWHPDHAGSAERLRAHLGATVWVPRPELEIVGGVERPPNPNFAPYLWRPMVIRYVASVVRDGGLRVDPVAETNPYDETTELPGGLIAIPTPGHTDGHHSLFDPKRGLLFAGDALATVDFLTWKSRPRALPRRLNQDNDATLRSLAKIEASDAAIVLPGHGGVWRRGAARAAAIARSAGILG